MQFGRAGVVQIRVVVLPVSIGAVSGVLPLNNREKFQKRGKSDPESLGRTEISGFLGRPGLLQCTQ